MQTIVKRKQILLLVLLFIFSACNLFSQVEKPQKCSNKGEQFAFGPKMSINFTNGRLLNHLTTNFSPGVDMGLFFRISFSHFYLQPEILYAVRNQKFSLQCFPNPCQDAKIQDQHIDVPLLFGVKAVDFKQFKIRFFVGPEFSYNLSIDVCQLGFQAGLGFDIWRFTIDAGYSFLGNVSPGTKGHNNILKVGVGFKCY
jgi:hypothetical protein